MKPPLAPTPLWPLAIYFAGILVLIAGILGLSCILGERHHERGTGVPYESGMLPTGSARLRFDIKYYLVAMLFVIFDLETVFLVAWAVAFRELGWIGYIEALVFIGVLVAALVYLWKVGALDWGTQVSRRRRRSREGVWSTLRE